MWKRVLIVFALLVTPTLAQALDIYVGGGLGSDVTAGQAANEPGLDQPGTDSTGDRYKLFAGLYLARYLAVEASYYDFGGQHCCAPQISDLGLDSSTTAYSAALLGRLPIGRFVVYGKVGTLRWRENATFITIQGASDRSDQGTDPLFGAGVDFGVTDSFALRGEWERYEFGGNSSDGVWAAAHYRF